MGKKNKKIDTVEPGIECPTYSTRINTRIPDKKQLWRRATTIAPFNKEDAVKEKDQLKILEPSPPSHPIVEMNRNSTTIEHTNWDHIGTY